MAIREKPGAAAKRGAPTALATVLVIHGPNLNLLGLREPEIYGRTRLGDIDRALKELGRELGLKVETFQSNSEGAIVDRIQRARGRARALVINPGAYTHTSVAIRDAITACDLPTVEVHLSNVYAREPFRHHSTIAGIVVGRIMGFGAEGYLLALRAARRMVETKQGAADA
ncbi:MAG TPA: type II 3-dehydroquinate dehydratase [Candidatus Binataceae bacterium]